jgi:surface polysaccharide O-acyltransferase-like enzyme
VRHGSFQTLYRSNRYDLNPLVRNDLSIHAKQSFQVVALLATILVVGIHYQSDVPDQPSPAAASWNELAQEFLFGGIGRVAVPMFALAAGFFYFRSDDGSLATYRKKLHQRSRTVLFPYFIFASIAMAAWLAARRLEGDSVDLTIGEFLATWLLRPPSEQLWFLRDLMVLVVIAPVIRRVCAARIIRRAFLGGLSVVWALNLQCFPIVAGWRLLHLETLLFFSLGCVAVSHVDWIERIGRAHARTFAATCALWCGLITARIGLRADFDIWYRSDYSLADLLFHQASVLVGCVALFMIAWRIRCGILIRLSGASFFVYLVHEFPLRAVVERVLDRFVDPSTSCWLALPIVLVGCFGAALSLSRHLPTFVSVLTGGRTPDSAAQITQSTSHSISTSSSPAHAPVS